MPCALSAIASSPPLPNTYGSPPFSLTIYLPSSALATSSSLISSCALECLPLLLPAYISSQLSCANSSRCSSIKSSYTITSALLISDRPLSVINSYEPQPAPTSAAPGSIFPLPLSRYFCKNAFSSLLLHTLSAFIQNSETSLINAALFLSSSIFSLASVLTSER